MKLGKTPKSSGITLAQNAALVVLGVIALFFAAPFFVRAPVTTGKSACFGNLGQIEKAKAKWALEKKKTAGEPVVDAEVIGFIKGSAPSCPAGGNYTFNPVGVAPTCSIASDGHSL